MTQVTSKTSWRLPKVHLRTYNRSLGGLVVKWECAERVKVTQNGCLWEKPMSQEMSKNSKGLSKVHFWSYMRCQVAQKWKGLHLKWIVFVASMKTKLMIVIWKFSKLTLHLTMEARYVVMKAVCLSRPAVWEEPCAITRQH